MGTGSRPGRAWSLADRAGGRVPVPILRDGPGRCGGRGTGTSAALRSQSPFRLRSEFRIPLECRVRGADRPKPASVRTADPTNADLATHEETAIGRTRPNL